MNSFEIVVKGFIQIISVFSADAYDGTSTTAVFDLN